eukprot:364792-Chlamydomonas_euryale.AAC.7
MAACVGAAERAYVLPRGSLMMDGFGRPASAFRSELLSCRGAAPWIHAWPYGHGHGQSSSRGSRARVGRSRRRR